VAENVEYMEELKSLATKLGISDMVDFKPSVSDAERDALLDSCLCVLYTPTNEHFGIVPIEVGANKKPVIAVNSGGPLESILDGQTGFLCNPTKEKFAGAILRLLQNKQLSEEMGIAAEKHIRAKFSLSAFSKQLEKILIDLVEAN